MKNIFILTMCFWAIIIEAKSINLQSGGDVSKWTQISNSQTQGIMLGQFNSPLYSAPELEKSMQGNLLKIRNLSYLAEENKPLVPKQTLTFELDGNYKIHGVVVNKGSVETSGEVENLLKGAKRVSWSDNSQSVSTDQKVNTFYPGRWLGFNSGFDGKTTRVYIQLYPIQYNEQTEELLFLENCSISIYGEPANVAINPGKMSVTNADHLLIAPAAWNLSADSLAQVHNQQGVTSAVINAEDIYAQYTSAENPSESGYANSTNSAIINYQYDNALKIVAYLRDLAAHPNLKYLTIVGDAAVIPPSYYFYCDMPGESVYSKWIPSDFYYASPDYDWVDNFGNNRLSFTKVGQLSIYRTKLQNWIANLSGDWIRKSSVEGGNPFNDQFFIGEMIGNQVICDNLFNGFQINKFQRSNNKFNKTAMVNHLKNDDFLFHLNIAHGSGSSVDFDNYTDITGSSFNSYAAKSKLPIYLSVACQNGAFDTRLYNGGNFGLTSFAESMTRSKGAAISYIGGSRTNGGGPLFNVDNGEVSFFGTVDTYSLLYHYLKVYRDQNAPTFGSLFSGAKQKFLAENELALIYNKAALVRFVQHGSAGTKLPAAPPINSLTTPPHVALNNGVSIDWYQDIMLNPTEQPNYTLSDGNVYDIKNVSFKLTQTSTSSSVTGYTFADQSNISYSFTINNAIAKKHYLNKIITSEAKETWHYSYIDRETGIEDENLILTNSLSQNYPNPFNPSTIINFQLSTLSRAKIQIFDVTGRNISTVVNQIMSAGNHKINFNAVDLAAGIYFYSLYADDKLVSTRKMMLVK